MFICVFLISFLPFDTSAKSIFSIIYTEASAMSDECKNSLVGLPVPHISTLSALTPNLVKYSMAFCMSSTPISLISAS